MFSRLISIPFITILALSSLASISHAAKIYHWIDEQGRSHYSENLPRNKQAEPMNVKATGKGSSGTSSVSSEAKKKSKNSSEKKETMKELKAEISPEDKAKYCQQSRELLQQMNGNVQRRFEQPDGSYRKLSPDEIADYKTQAQEGIKNYCQ